MQLLKTIYTQLEHKSNSNNVKHRKTYAELNQKQYQTIESTSYKRLQEQWIKYYRIHRDFTVLFRLLNNGGRFDAVTGRISDKLNNLRWCRNGSCEQ